MGVLSNIRQGIRRRVERALSQSGPRAQVYGSRTDPPPRGTEDFLEAYDSAPWVRAIAGTVARSVGDTEWQLSRMDRADRPVPANHILLRTLRRPNTMMSGSSLIRVTQLCLDLTGDAFWLLERNGLGKPDAFWPIPPHWIYDTPRPSSPYYKISWRRWQADIPETSMFWAHDPSPSNPYTRGRGILQALSDEVTTDEFAAKHANSIFFNRASPEFVAMTDEGTDESDLEVMERRWDSRLRGLYRAMRPYFINRQIKFWQPNQMNLENLTLVPLRKFERDIQMQCWGIPPEQLGVIEKSNRATADASDHIMEKRLLSPRRKFLAEELSIKLAPIYDERLEVGFAMVDPRDRDLALDAMKANPAAFEFDDWRKLAGLAPIGGELGKARVIPLNSYITTNPLDAASRPNQPGAAANQQGSAE